jgi:hypothetical protein|tara:strand:- start:921 stop:1166 length:246 start_codon:yes stop_codon:yes gene_type:complete
MATATTSPEITVNHSECVKREYQYEIQVNDCKVQVVEWYSKGFGNVCEDYGREIYNKDRELTEDEEEAFDEFMADLDLPKE